MLNPKIIIIGVGPSGIACATKLIEYGFENLTILEAEARIGGRVHTIPFGENVVDLGAQWCHGEKNNVVYEMVKDLNLVESSGDMQDKYKLIRSNGEILNEDLTKRLLEMYDELIERRDSIEHETVENASEFFKKEFEKLLNLPQYQDIDRNVALEFLENVKKIESSADGCDNFAEMSAASDTYEQCEGNQTLNWKGKGYKTILELLLQTKETKKSLGILNECIQFGKTAMIINWQRSDSKVLITCKDGEIFLADHVIVTVSLGVLKSQHKELFVPQLPFDKVAAIENINFGTVNKIFIEFAEKFWPDNWETGFAMLWRDEDLKKIQDTKRAWLGDILGFFGVSHQPRVLGGWIVGPNARYIETLEESEIKAACLEVLRQFLPFHIPEPVNFIVTAWSKNPNFKGSYSYHSIKTEAAGVSANDLSAPLMVGKNLKVQFAGEATIPKHFSTVHGAIETGWREAKRLAIYHNILHE